MGFQVQETYDYARRLVKRSRNAGCPQSQYITFTHKLHNHEYELIELFCVRFSQAACLRGGVG